MIQLAVTTKIQLIKKQNVTKKIRQRNMNISNHWNSEISRKQSDRNFRKITCSRPDLKKLLALSRSSRFQTHVPMHIHAFCYQEINQYNQENKRIIKQKNKYEFYFNFSLLTASVKFCSGFWLERAGETSRTINFLKDKDIAKNEVEKTREKLEKWKKKNVN